MEYIWIQKIKQLTGEIRAKKNKIKSDRPEIGTGEHLGRNWCPCLRRKLIAHVRKLKSIIWPKDEKTGWPRQSSNKILANCKSQCWGRATF